MSTTRFLLLCMAAVACSSSNSGTSADRGGAICTIDANATCQSNAASLQCCDVVGGQMHFDPQRKCATLLLPPNARSVLACESYETGTQLSCGGQTEVGCYSTPQVDGTVVITQTPTTPHSGAEFGPLTRGCSSDEITWILNNGKNLTPDSGEVCGM